MNLHEIEEAIRELEQGSCTYSNCQKLASLYIIRDQMRKNGQGMYTYGRSNYGYYPMYERGNNSSYGYRRPMYYENDDLMIKKDNMMREQDHMM